MRKSTTATPARRSSSRARSWWPYAIAAAVLVATAGFALSLQSAGSSHQSPGRGGPAAERGLPVGAAAPSRPLQSSAGGSLSLAQMRGTKVVVYFYEAGG
jgi:hypothetical protein